MQPIRLDHELIALLSAELRSVAGDTVTAIRQEVPSYAGALSGEMGANIEGAVQMALAGFLRLADRGVDVDAATPLSPALEGAYALGRGEARSGRSADALLAAYRVGARVAWRELSAIAVAQGAGAEDLASFAELVFAYIDELSAASVSGHADELATSGRVRQRYLERLAQALLAGASEEALQAGADRADWKAPGTLTAVLVPESQARPARNVLDPGTLQPTGDLPGLPEDDGVTVLLVPDAGGRERGRLLRSLAGRHAVVGPVRPWREVRASYDRAVRARPLADGSAALDTDEHLVPLLLGSDPGALADLRARALAPLADLRPATAEKLAETLRWWLLHQGRRDEVAAALFVHPQTVRYRMGQLRELYGDRLEDPQTVLELTIALATSSATVA
jgi:hypothetical protein